MPEIRREAVSTIAGVRYYKFRNDEKLKTEGTDKKEIQLDRLEGNGDEVKPEQLCSDHIGPASIKTPEGYDNFEAYFVSYSKEYKATMHVSSPPEPEKYYTFKESIGEEWLNRSTDFIYRAAQDINAGQVDEAKTQHNWEELLEYSKGVCEFFNIPKEAKRDEVYVALEPIKEAINELATQMAAGKGDSLDTLNTKIKLNDIELSLSQLVRLQKGMKGIVSGIESYEDYAGCASVGLSVSALRMFAEKNFDKEISNKVVSMYENKIQAGYKRLMEQLPPTSYGVPGTRNYYFMQNLDINDGQTLISVGYKTFANLDTSSADAFRNSYNKACGWFYGETDQWFDMCGIEKGYGHGRWRGVLNGMYKTALSLDSIDINI